MTDAPVTQGEMQTPPDQDAGAAQFDSDRGLGGAIIGTFKSLLPLLILGVALVAAAQLARWVMLSKKPESAIGGEAPPVNVEVRVVRAIRQRVDDFEVPAAVKANRVVRVSAEVAGRIEKINFKEGDTCVARAKTGRRAKEDGPPPLVELNTELLQAELDRARAAGILAKADYERISQLERQGGTTKQALDKARAALRTSEAEEDLAEARLKRTRIFAPIDGVLNDLLVEKGEYVKAGSPVAEIVEIDKVKVVAPVPERDVPFLKIGDRAVVLVDRRTNGQEEVEQLIGGVTYINELADEKTRTTPVEIALDNRRRRLRSGRIVRVRFTRQILTNVIMVPLDAVIPLEKGKAVYVVERAPRNVVEGGVEKVVEEEVARRREVKVNTRFIKNQEWGGPQNGNHRRRVQMIQVLPWPNGDRRKGLKDGDRLIVIGQHFVAPGQRVKVTSPQSGSKPKSEATPRTRLKSGRTK